MENQTNEKCYMTFGRYPQSRVENEELISVLNELVGELPENGKNRGWTSYKYYIFDEDDKDFMWYADIAHEGNIYRGVYFTDCRPNETMNTSEENRQEENGYSSGVVYWFLYEPIEWQMLKEQDGKAWLLSRLCIDSRNYRDVVWNNSYVNSTIRKWLNCEFINMAFEEEERERISTELIINEMEDEDVCDGDKPGSDTLDRVHLLSMPEASDLLPNGQRKTVGTDYAFCQGLGKNRDSGNSVWWLRTPYYSIDSWAYAVGALDICDFCSEDIGATDVGIRPAIWVKV